MCHLNILNFFTNGFSEHSRYECVTLTFSILCEWVFLNILAMDVSHYHSQLSMNGSSEHSQFLMNEPSEHSQFSMNGSSEHSQFLMNKPSEHSQFFINGPFEQSQYWYRTGVCLVGFPEYC